MRCNLLIKTVLSLQTMLMDQARLHALQVQVNQVAIIAAVLLMTSSICGSRAYSSPGCIDRLKHIIKALVEELPDMRQVILTLFSEGR